MRSIKASLSARHLSQLAIALCILCILVIGLMASDTAASTTLRSGITSRYRWNPRAEECKPAPPAVRSRNGKWLLYFGGFGSSTPTESRSLGISGPPNAPRRGTVFVRTPTGTVYRAPARIGVRRVHFVRWPSHFRGAPGRDRAGVYTVLWRVRSRGLWCAGFKVR